MIASPLSIRGRGRRRLRRWVVLVFLSWVECWLTVCVQANGKAKKQKAEKPPAAPKQSSAVYVTSLPDDVDEEEIWSVFKKYGMIAESAETNAPRIKLYVDEQGNFKGDALVGES